MQHFTMTLPAWLIAGLTLLGQPALGAAVTPPTAAVPTAAVTWTAGSELSGPVQADSIFRDGDQLHFIIVQPASRGPGHTYSSQVQMSCANPGTSWVAYSESVRRAYPDSPDGRYRPAVMYVAAQNQTLQHNPAVVAACHDTPEPQWRVVNAKPDDRWLLVDANSLQHQGDNQRIWASWDDPAETVSLPYEAPRAQTREHLQFNCARGTYQVLARAVLDRSGHVTDGLTFPTDKESLVKNDGPYQPLFSLLCEQPKALQTLAPFKARDKLPVRKAVPYVAPRVVAQFAAVPLPKARLVVDSLVETGTVVIKGKELPVRNLSNFYPLNDSGLTVQQKDGAHYDYTTVNFHGLFNIALRGRESGVATWIQDMSTTDAHFSGDWQALASGSQLDYTAKMSMAMNHFPAIDDPALTVSCHVDEEVPATQINNGLSGNAKHVPCVQTVHGDKIELDSYYLEDYGLFYIKSRKSSTFDETMTLLAIGAHHD